VTGSAIELRDVWVRFGDRVILEAVSLNVARGEFLGLIGPNGGGKTTLLRVVLGLLAPERGTVRVLERAPHDARGLVGYVAQHAQFDRDFPIRVLDVVLMGRLRGGRLARPLRRTDVERAEKTLERLEIGDLGGRQIGRLSGGQLQRVLIARALAMDPEILILDEPTASLDIHSEEGFYDLLHELSQEKTVLLVSHDVGAVSAHVRRIACINRRLFEHPTGRLTKEIMEMVYGYPLDLILHGIPQRVLDPHASQGDVE
jgi:zinc transport system ATP-binding protein